MTETKIVSQYMVLGGDKIPEIITNSALKYVPFRPEPLTRWNDQTDLRQFCAELYNIPGEIITEDGKRHFSESSKSIGYQFFEFGVKEFFPIVDTFVVNLQESLTTSNSEGDFTEVFNFYENPVFGQTAKNFIAWDRLVHRALEESVYFSIAHVLESLDDLKSSFNLAANFYYKQALQTLRNYIEDMVLPIHFCENPQEYSNWKADNYRIPSLRGQNGLLKKLKDSSILSSQLADSISSLYGELNGFVHGSEKRLINKGQYSNGWAGHTFKNQDFLEWCKFVNQAIEIGVHLLKINLEQWRGFKSGGRVLCSTCHNDKNFDIVPMIFGGHHFKIYSCLECSEKMTLDSGFNKFFKVTFSENPEKSNA